MKLKAVLTVSAFYLAVLGIGFMFAPRQIGIDAHAWDCSVESTTTSPIISMIIVERVTDDAIRPAVLPIIAWQPLSERTASGRKSGTVILLL